MNRAVTITALIAIAIAAVFVPAYAQDELIHDRMDFGEHPEFKWYSNLVGWLSYYDGLVAGLPELGFRSAIVSGVRFDETIQNPYFIARIDRNDLAKFYIGYTLVPGMFSDYRYQSIDYGVFIDSTGVVSPSWDAENEAHWGAWLPAGIYDMRISIDRAASTMSADFDSVPAYDASISDFTSPVLSVSDTVDLTDFLYIQMNFYNQYSAVFDVWSVKPTPSVLWIHHPNPQTVMEGDTIVFNTSAEYDGEKELIWSFEDPRFERDGDFYRWITRDGHAGLYSSRLTVTDGRLVDSTTYTYAVTEKYDPAMGHDRMDGTDENPNEWRLIDESFWYYTRDGYLRGSSSFSWTSAGVTTNEVDLSALRAWVFRVEVSLTKAAAFGFTETLPQRHDGRHGNLSLGIFIDRNKVSKAWYSPSTQFEGTILPDGIYDIRITWDPAIDEARFEAVPVAAWPDSLSDFADAVWTTYADGNLDSPAWIQASVIADAVKFFDIWCYVPSDGPALVEEFSADARPAEIELGWTVGAHNESGEFVILRCPGVPEGCRELMRIPLIEGITSYGYEDRDVLPGSVHDYRVYLDRGRGMEMLFETGEIEVPVVPARLYQNWPNPFNPGTEIGWYLPEASRVRITIFDTAGRPVRRLLDAEYEAGRNSVEWDGTMDGGGAAASGVYFYRIEAGSFDEARKMILIR
jgi:hypothetical protein